MKFTYNRRKESLINVLKSKCDKKNLNCICEQDKIRIESKPGTNKYDQTPIPVNFVGKIKEEDVVTTIDGMFSYGFYLTTLVIAAIVLIAARLAWSVYKMQEDNIVLCVLAATLLFIVCLVTYIKGKPLKKEMLALLNDLEKK